VHQIKDLVKIMRPSKIRENKHKQNEKPSLAKPLLLAVRAEIRGSPLLAVIGSQGKNLWGRKGSALGGHSIGSSGTHCERGLES